MALVMTNDLHNLVFRLDLCNPNWSSEYAYGPVVYIVMAGCFAPLAAGLAIMLYKARRNSRKMGFIFPLAFAAMLLIYAIAYITRIPVAWENDVSIVLGLFSCLFYEAAIQTGMIPVNIKYAALFTHSPLSMQITDSSGNAVLISDYARQADMAMYMHMTAPFPPTIQVDEDTLLFSGQIPGGFVRWKEDIAQLNSLRKKLETSIGQLRAANAILAEEEKVKRAADEENARRLLTAQLDNEIAAHTAKLSEMLNRLENAADISAETVRIALLLCYIKRRCGLFFKEEESAALPPDELAAYINELAEIAGYSDIRVIAVNNLTEPLQIRRSFLYSFPIRPQ